VQEKPVIGLDQELQSMEMIATDFMDHQARYKEISKSKRLPFDPSPIVIQLNMVI